jgi:hypothetical protein
VQSLKIFSSPSNSSPVFPTLPKFFKFVPSPSSSSPVFQTFLKCFKFFPSSDVEAEAEAEAPEAVDLFWKQKHLKICRFRFRSVSKLLFKFW